MIGFYLSLGSPFIDTIFTPYISSEWGWDSISKRSQSAGLFGKDLELFLIEFYVDGEFEIALPKSRKLGNYVSKTRTVSARIPVRNEEFYLVGDQERKQFLAEAILWAVTTARKRLEKRGLDIDFAKLLRHVEEKNRQYLSSSRTP